jgi:Protein of unknown function (DUF2798)
MRLSIGHKDCRFLAHSHWRYICILEVETAFDASKAKGRPSGASAQAGCSNLPRRRFDKTMLRIPRRHGHFVFGVIQSGLTSAIAAGVASIPFLGTFAFIENWLGSWLIAWMTTIPIVMLAAPVIRRLVLALTIDSDDRGRGI